MATNKVFTDWDDTHSVLWGHQPIRLSHDVHKSPLFSMDRLAGLIALEPGFPAARIGIHEGSAILAHADYFGATVNVCSRLMEHARPGQIVCSERVAAQVAGQGAVWTHPLGLLRLKHLAQPVSAYELGFEGAHAPLQFIDPVCRMQVADDGYLERTYAGRTLRFCSTECERRFFEQRELYLDAPTPS